MKHKFYILLLIFTAILLGIEYFMSSTNGLFTRNVVQFGTIILAGIAFLSFYFTEKSISHENPNQFVRGVMLATLIKLFLCIIGVGILLVTLRKDLHKPDLFLLMFVYMIYSTVEAVIMSKISRIKK
jgi:hypothetical protein